MYGLTKLTTLAGTVENAAVGPKDIVNLETLSAKLAGGINSVSPVIFGNWNTGVTATAVAAPGAVLCALANTSVHSAGISAAAGNGTIDVAGTHTCWLKYKVRLESTDAYGAQSRLYIDGVAVDDGFDELKQPAVATTGSGKLAGAAIITGLTNGSTVTVQVTNLSGTFTIVGAEVNIESIYTA